MGGEFLGQNATVAIKMISYLKRLAIFIVKRSLGVRLGLHANQEYLQDYERAIHDPGSLNKLIPQLKRLLGEDKFLFNMIQSFGQPQIEETTEENRVPILLVGSIPNILIYQAPNGNERLPSHDYPFFRVGTNKYSIPLTFDFYMALRLRQEGCASSSLPASVRAAIDKVKQQLAGSQCRDLYDFLGHSTSVFLLDDYCLNLEAITTPPFLARRDK